MLSVISAPVTLFSTQLARLFNPAGKRASKSVAAAILTHFETF
jgi:hypothetical protein